MNVPSLAPLPLPPDSSAPSGGAATPGTPTTPGISKCDEVVFCTMTKGEGATAAPAEAYGAGVLAARSAALGVILAPAICCKLWLSQAKVSNVRLTATVCCKCRLQAGTLRSKALIEVHDGASNLKRLG